MNHKFALQYQLNIVKKQKMNAAADTNDFMGGESVPQTVNHKVALQCQRSDPYLA